MSLRRNSPGLRLAACLFVLLVVIYLLLLRTVFDADLDQSKDHSKLQIQQQKTPNSSEIKNVDDHLQWQNKIHVQLQTADIDTVTQCDYGYFTDYAATFKKPISIHTKRVTYKVNEAYGCSVYHEYCNGPIQSIPCCRKLLYDMWYAIDEYFTKYNVTYSYNWGSLLFAVRDGQHAPWDAKDLDLAFLWTKKNAMAAVNEFITDYNLSLNGNNHILDPKMTFYKLHHEKYGYPSQTEQYCFYAEMGVGDYDLPSKRAYGNIKKKQMLELLENPDALYLGGLCPFIDFKTGGVKSGGMGNYAKHITRKQLMIPTSYYGPHGIKPPRKIYIFPDYWKALYDEYGEKWPEGYTFLTDKQLEYYGLDKWNDHYFKKLYIMTMNKLKKLRYIYKDLDNDWRFLKFKNLNFSWLH